MNKLYRFVLVVVIATSVYPSVLSAQSLLDSAVFDWKFYINHHVGICKAGIDTRAEAEHHWQTIGAANGLQGVPYFDVNYYRLVNADLTHLTPLQAIDHYLAIGRFEPRSFVTGNLPTVPAGQCDGFLDRSLYRSADIPNVSYAYAPAIVYDGTNYHAFFCSNPFDDNGNIPAGGFPGIDTIRYSISTDQGKSWAQPRVILEVTDFVFEHAACDPSVIYWQGYFYLYYTGLRQDVQGVIFLARSSSINGDYEKLVGFNGEQPIWSQSQYASPHALVLPRFPQLSSTNIYGAGQSSIIVDGGTLYMWYTDTTDSLADLGRESGRAFRITAQTPWGFSNTNMQRVMSNGQDIFHNSVEVRYDRSFNRLLMTQIREQHKQNSHLTTRISYDMGLNWTAPFTICESSNCMPDIAHNVGVAGDVFGNLPVTNREHLVGFGAGYDSQYTSGANIDPVFVGGGSRTSLYVGRYDLNNGCEPLPNPVIRPHFNIAADELPGLSVNRLNDGNEHTVYSSNVSFSPYVSNKWTVSYFPGLSNIQSINLVPRPRNTPFPPHPIDIDLRALHFPVSYELLLTNQENTNFVFLTSESKQPGFSHYTTVLDDLGNLEYQGDLRGYPVHYQFNEPVNTHGVLVNPTVLSDFDGDGVYYYQMADIDARLHRTCRAY